MTPVGGGAGGRAACRACGGRGLRRQGIVGRCVRVANGVRRESGDGLGAPDELRRGRGVCCLVGPVKGHGRERHRYVCYYREGTRGARNVRRVGVARSKGVAFGVTSPTPDPGSPRVGDVRPQAFDWGKGIARRVACAKGRGGGNDQNVARGGVVVTWHLLPEEGGVTEGGACADRFRGRPASQGVLVG